MSWYKSPKESAPWLVFTDFSFGVMTMILLAFIALWTIKESFKEEYIKKNKAFTRKEQEYQVLKEAKETADRKIKNYQNMMGAQLKAPIEEGLIAITDAGIDIQESLLFPNGSAVITQSGQNVMQLVAQALKVAAQGDSTFLVMACGFTDDIPMDSKTYSNWELSSERATNVVKSLIAKGFEPNRVFAAGFGEFQPKVPNDSKKNRAINRRVEIRRVPFERNKFAFTPGQ